MESLKKLEKACNQNPSLERLCRELETHQKACYLPLYTFALKPLYRLLHYQQILLRMFLIDFFVPKHKIDDISSDNTLIGIILNVFFFIGSLDLYAASDNEYKIIKECLSQLQTLCQSVEELLPESLNFYYLCLLHRDLDG